jgi:hypothetical protein
MFHVHVQSLRNTLHSDMDIAVSCVLNSKMCTEMHVDLNIAWITALQFEPELELLDKFLSS